MKKYHYQCSSCYCTLHADPLEEGEKWVYVITGELCISCEKEQEMKNLFDVFDEDDLDD